ERLLALQTVRLGVYLSDDFFEIWDEYALKDDFDVKTIEFCYVYLDQPSSPYSASKAMGELQMQTFDKVYNLATVSLRFFMVYGPRQPRSGAYAIVTGVFAGQRERGEPLTIEGDGLQFRDFVHVKDIARGITLAYQSDRVRGGQPINLGSGEAHTVQELADLVSPNQKRLPARKNDLRGTLADTCKAKAVLGELGAGGLPGALAGRVVFSDENIVKIHYSSGACTRS
ncbi:hypothetical protein FOZ62_032433, partial [Perkinsus olseni]